MTTPDEFDLQERIARALYERDVHEIGRADEPSWDELSDRGRQPHLWRAGTVYTQFVAPLLDGARGDAHPEDQIRRVSEEIMDRVVRPVMDERDKALAERDAARAMLGQPSNDVAGDAGSAQVTHLANEVEGGGGDV